MKVLRGGIPWMADALAWAFGLTLAVLARHEFDLVDVPAAGTAVTVLVATVLQTLGGHLQFLHRGRYAYGSFHEVRAVFVTVLVTCAASSGSARCAPTCGPRRRPCCSARVTPPRS